MIKNFFSARLLVAALCVSVGAFSSYAAVVANWEEGTLGNGVTKNGFTMTCSTGATANEDGTITVAGGNNTNQGLKITWPEGWTAADEITIVTKYSELNKASDQNCSLLEIQTDTKIDANTNSRVIAATYGNGESVTMYRSYYQGDANTNATHYHGKDNNDGKKATGSPSSSGWLVVSLSAKTRAIKYAFFSESGERVGYVDADVGEGYANGFCQVLIGGSNASSTKYHRWGMVVKSVSILTGSKAMNEAYAENGFGEWLSQQKRASESEVKNISGEISVSTLNKSYTESSVLRLNATEKVTLTIDTEFSADDVLATFTGTFEIARGEEISDEIVHSVCEKLVLNNKQIKYISGINGKVEIGENDTIVMDRTDEVTITIDESKACTIPGVTSGKIIKKGFGTLKLTGLPAINGTTFEIEEGTLYLDAGNNGISLENPTFIMGEYGALDSQAGMTINGTLTIYSDYEKRVFANRDIWGGPVIVKEGAGLVKVMCGSKNYNGNKEPFSKVIVKSGTLAFGGNGIKEITALEGEGTLEQAGGGDMTISKVSQETETSLKVSAGALNNECATYNGSLTLAGLEIAAGATYTMPSINHLKIAKSFYLEGDAHKRWYVTLEDGALIATNPKNPMTLAGLEFGNSVKLGKDQTIGSVLAKTIKPANLDSIVAKNEDEQLNAFNFALDYAIDSIVVKMQNQEKMMVEAVPDIGLVGAQYRVYVPVPEGYENDPGSIWVTVSNGGPTEDAAQVIKKDENNRWYALIEHSANGLAAGNGQKIDIAVGYRDGANIVKVDSYSDVLVNVRPDAVNNGWINETAHERWSTGEWDSEGEYVVISNGYVQVASDNSVSFSPSNVPKEPEAESKIHFSVVFGEGMKLDIINALVDEDQFAGVGLIKEGETYQYCVIDPSIVDGDKYVNAKVAKQSVARIDPKAEHLVEITINHAGNFVSYSVDGATLTDTDGKAIFHLPAKTKIAKIDFLGNGAVKNMSAEEYSTKLAAYDGVEYDTIEKAIIAAKGDSTITVTPLWDALWTPSSELRDKAIKFEGDYKVIPVVNDSDLAANDMVLDYDEATKIYKVISKFLTVSIPDPEENDDFGVFLESITTNSMHLVWTYDYKSATPSFAKATVVYGDDVTINFSNTLDNGANGALLVAREGAEDGEGKTIEAGTQVKSVTFHQVRYNTEVKSKHIPVLGGENYDSTARAKVKALYDYGIAAPKAMVADINIIDFTAASDGVTFNIAALDGVSDMDKIAAVSNLVWFSTDLKNWELVADDGIKINEDGSITVKQVGSTGFYKVLIQ